MTHPIQEFIPFADGWPDGPARLVLIGPPGTGKTTAILDCFVSEYMDAVNRMERDPARLLCCSFSTAAASELSARIAKQFTPDPIILRQTVSTVHSAALRIIRETLGDQKRYDGMTRKASDFARGKGGEADPLSNLYDQTGNPLRAAALSVWDMTRARRRDRDSTWFRDLCRRTVTSNAELRSVMDVSDPESIVVTITAEIDAYEREKRDAHAIDFTDVLLLALTVPAPERNLLILDEAQDCTPLQWELFHHWGSNAVNVVVVGDCDQAIQEWAGADASFIESVARGAVDGWETRALMKSYRVPERQHAEARSIITLINDRPDVPYHPAERTGSIYRTEDYDDAVAVLRECTRKRRGFVLCRTREQCDVWGRMFMAAGIAATGRGCPLSAPTKVWAFQALVALRNNTRADSIAWRTLAKMLPAATEFSVFRERGAKGKLTDALAATGGEDEDSAAQSEALVREALGGRVDEWLALPLGRCAAHLVGMDSRYVAALTMVAESGGTLDPEQAAIEVMTMHHSKGREADVVVIDAAMPPVVRREYEVSPDYYGGAIDAERRLLYVAMTRSRDVTVICGRRPWYPELCGG